MQAQRSVDIMSVIAFEAESAKKSIKDEIAEKIAALIASGVLQVGDVLPSERDIAAGLNVSRETIRGAMSALAARGILSVSHGARTRVISANVGPVTIGIGKARAMDAYSVEAVHASRLLIEREVVADAALRIDKVTMARLEASLQAQSAALGDPVRFLICDREFHLTIYAKAGNALLADFASDLYAHMMTYRRKAVARPGAIAQSIDDHQAIMEALRARDADAAVKAFATHTERINATTRSVLDTAG
jgi:DNA-binding FadR family transcriptional regulator